VFIKEQIEPGIVSCGREKEEASTQYRVFYWRRL
jgi:hypothetical protein